MQTFPQTEVGPARELDLVLVISDLSGYTALTETHGALKASEIVLRFERLARESLEPGVKIVSTVGDAVLCAGEDTLAVVRSALRLRDKVEREAEFPRIRTGMHCGTIVEREGKLFGTPINLTARLAAHANGGEILCSEPIARAIDTLADFEPHSLGEMRFKNVAQPVAVYKLARISERRAAAAIDPVCRMQVAIERAAAAITHGEKVYHFCSRGCERAFASAPDQYVRDGGG